MKKTSLITAVLAGLCSTAFAQVPVTTGLKLHLDAGSGYNANGAAAATWNDLSGANNHLTSGNAGTAEPVWNANSAGAGYPGVKFDGTSDYMTRLANQTSGWNSTAATLFVVRIANTASNTINETNFSGARTTLSIGENNSFNNEFLLMGNWGEHTTSSGQWVRKDHQCYPSLPNNLPAVTAVALNTGLAGSDLNYYVNGIISNKVADTSGTPAPYTAAARSIIIGGRYDSPLSLQSMTWFDGYILEIVAYNRLLTPTEIDDVNTYLKCKYKINYAACNVIPTCTPPIGGCDDLCYWRVVGNNINDGKNIFGTLTDDDVRIQTNSTDRGILKGGSTTFGGFFGWNTMNPTARLHVNCAGGNYESGVSDIRFQGLEQGTGNMLAIDGNGYVYNSGVPVSGGPGLSWNVVGNSITGGNNFLGTNSAHNVVLRTNNINRGILTSGTSGLFGDDGRLGWQTLNPTAHFHVNCRNGNPEGSGASDVRFEQLERGTGSVLAIDDAGYVYNTGIPAGGGAAGTGWNVTGNNITGGNNFLGTNSPDDVVLRTSGIDKGILTSGMAGIPNDDGRLGWHTLNPTAHLHINCAGGNEDGSGMSDVRFEELETGDGMVLVIDDEGYVHNSRRPLSDIGGKAEAELAKLRIEVSELKAQVELLTNAKKAPGQGSISDGSRLYQNVPNPFGRETVIEYYIHKMEKNAYIMVYDLNGREMARYPIAASGKGKVTVAGDNLVSGMYLYSLVVDGQEIDSKRMALIK